VAVGAVSHDIANALSSLTLFLAGQQAAKFLSKNTVNLFHLPQLELPARAFRRSQFIKNVVL